MVLKLERTNGVELSIRRGIYPRGKKSFEILESINL